MQLSRTNDQWSTRVIFNNKTVAAHIHSPVFYRDHIYVSSFREQGGLHTGLVCLDLDGRVLWQTGPDLQFHDGGLLLADGMALIVDGQSGQLRLLEISAAGYRVLAEAKVLEGRQIWAPLALSGGKLLLRDQHQLKCLDLARLSHREIQAREAEASPARCGNGPRRLRIADQSAQTTLHPWLRSPSPH